MSDPTLPGIDFKDKMVWIGLDLNFLKIFNFEILEMIFQMAILHQKVGNLEIPKFQETRIPQKIIIALDIRIITGDFNFKASTWNEYVFGSMSHSTYVSYSHKPNAHFI